MKVERNYVSCLRITANSSGQKEYKLVDLSCGSRGQEDRFNKERAAFLLLLGVFF